MKKLIKIAAALLLIVTFAQKSTAQFKASAGLELGFALESNFGLMYGVSGGGEFALGDNGGITAQAGYILNTVDVGGFFDKYSFNFLPVQLGYKYYFDSNESGVYLHGQIGIHVMMSSIEYTQTNYDIDPNTFQVTETEEKVSESDSQTNLSYAFGGGYLINEHIDLGLRYNIISAKGGSFNYIALRAAYNF
jgi:hypothetical protein